MRRIVFVDIDGVLNSGRYFRSRGPQSDGLFLSPFDEEQIDPVAVALLQRILSQTGAEPIISSSWRIAHRLERLQRILSARGLTSRLAGVTPNLMTDERHEEIDLWLARHGLDVESFVIVDDDPRAGLNFEDHFVHTVFQEGLTEAHAERAIALLMAGDAANEGLGRADTERPPAPPAMAAAPAQPASPTFAELPESCCKNVGRRQFRACGDPAKHWYQHGDDVCSYCDRHDYRCGERLTPKFFPKFT